MTVSADERRQLNLLKLSLVMAAPADPKESEELTRIAANLNATYGKGKWCPNPEQRETCLNIDDITKIMATSRDEKWLRQVWRVAHDRPAHAQRVRSVRRAVEQGRARARVP